MPRENVLDIRDMLVFLFKLILRLLFHNSYDCLSQPMLNLLEGNHNTETVGPSGTSTIFWNGMLKRWDTFESEVQTCVHDLKDTFDKVSHIPIFVKPDVKRLNEDMMIDEGIQAGAEITLSGRYFQNALWPVTSSVRTMSKKQDQSSNSALPGMPRFGDSWIVHVDHRDPKHQPDIVLKLPDKDVSGQIRLVGELKSCAAVNIGSLFREDKIGKKKAKGIIGQIIQYMICYNLKYGFLSNYNHTVFLKLTMVEEGQVSVPCVHYSNVIPHSSRFNDERGDINVRMGLLFLLRKCSADGYSLGRLVKDAIKERNDLQDDDDVPPSQLVIPVPSRHSARIAEMAVVSYVYDQDPTDLSDEEASFNEVVSHIYDQDPTDLDDDEEVRRFISRQT